MRVWLIKTGEPLPIDGPNERLLRAGMVANALVEKGHDVVWWSSTFDHMRKKHRFETDQTISVNRHLTLRLLHSIAYKKNISIHRLVNHYVIARKFRKLAPTTTFPPDVILCSMPTIDLSLAAVRFGKSHKIPVILDVRDLWPDLFLDMGPTWFRPVARALLMPMYQELRSACQDATALIGLTKPYLDWALSYAGRSAGELDREFPMAYADAPPSDAAIAKANRFWEQLGLLDGPNEFICCFVGTIGRHFELETIIHAAQKLGNDGRNIRFVLCGDGQHLQRYRNMASGSPHVLFPGWIGKAEIWTLLRKSSVGLAPYALVENFMKNLPNKPIEYLSAGLPVLTGIEGELGNLLRTNDCGLIYQYGNPDDLTTKLIELYDHPDQRERMAQNARTVFRERFTAEQVYGNMVKYLDEVTQTRVKKVKRGFV